MGLEKNRLEQVMFRTKRVEMDWNLLEMNLYNIILLRAKCQDQIYIYGTYELDPKN